MNTKILTLESVKTLVNDLVANEINKSFPSIFTRADLSILFGRLLADLEAKAEEQKISELVVNNREIKDLLIERINGRLDSIDDESYINDIYVENKRIHVSIDVEQIQEWVQEEIEDTIDFAHNKITK